MPVTASRKLASLLAAAVLLRCGPPTAPAHVEPTAPASQPAASQPAAASRPAARQPARPAACRAADGPVLLAPAVLDLTCDSPKFFSPCSCKVEVAATLVNCGPAPITLKRMLFTDPSVGKAAIFEPGDLQIPPGGSWQGKRQPCHTLRYTITTELGGPRPGPGPSAKVEVRNPTLEAARARCKAPSCNGDFKERGMMSILSCACRMPDAGKPCTDGDQCQGKCVSTPNRGFRCSKYKTVFGCHSYLPRGWSKHPPTPPGRIGRKVPSICVD